MKKIVLTACMAFVISSFFCTSCYKPTPCHVPKNDTSFIGSFYKSIVPYKVNNYINFKHSSGQTWTYKVQSIDSGYDFAQDNWDCPDNHRLQHVNYNLWKAGTTSTQWDLKLSLYYLFGSSIVSPNIKVNYMNYNYIGLAGFYPFPPDPIYQYDSIDINNSKYFFVNKMRLNNMDNATNVVFYNREYGILKVISPVDTLERIQ